MTTPEHTPAPEAVATEEVMVAESGTEDTSGKKTPGIPAFSFPFKPGELLQAKTQEQPYYKKSGKASHNKIPGAAPHGTRKSMGKR